MTNKHGLSRNIPSEVKRQVRQRDGFGCIVCGNALIEYEHFEPEFADAKAHHADGIVLLCVTCHGRKTRGHLSKETVASARLAPACRKIGFSFGAFDVGSGPPTIIVGTIIASNTECLLRIYGDEVLVIRPPEVEGGPVRLSATLRDGNGNTTLSIVDNEWRSSLSNWDTEVISNRITIKSELRSIELVLRTELPHRLIIERIDFQHRGVRIRCVEGSDTEIVFPSGDRLLTQRLAFNNAKVGIDVQGTSVGMGVGGSMHIAGHFNPIVPPAEPKSGAAILPFKRPN